MTLSDDLALVTACREHVAPLPEHWSTVQITGAALSLIEDTLNDEHREDDIELCERCGEDWPCPTVARAVAALHTIATALGVETPTKEET